MYVDDLLDGEKSYFKLFADDGKLYKDLQNLEDFETIKTDLNKPGDNKAVNDIQC